MQQQRLLLAGIVVLLCSPLRAQAPKDADEFFGLDKSWTVKITLSRQTLDGLYPKGGVRMGLSQRGRFKYGKGSVEIAGQKFATVGIRFKGNSSYWSAGGHLKKSYKVDFNRFVADQSFLGLRKLNLQNNVTDSSQVREAVSYAVYRTAGVPASRTAFGRVYLTVEGEFENEYLGSYTIVEQVDKQFMAHNFGDRDGLIMKPEGKVMPYLGDRWDQDYDRIYIPKTNVKQRHAKAVVQMAKRTFLEDDAKFDSEIGAALDVPQFLNYVAVTTYLANMDSPLRLAHNFYMVVPEKGRKVTWVPWDLNLSLGGFGMGRGRTSSVYRPTSLKLFVRLMERDAHVKTYEDCLRRVAKGAGSPESLAAFLAKARATTDAAIAAEADRNDVVIKVKEPRGGFMTRGRSSRRGNAASVRAGQDRFASGRAGTVLAQLEKGKPEGTTGTSNSMMSRMFSRGARRVPAEPIQSLREVLARSRVVRWKQTPQLDRDQIEAAAKKLLKRVDEDASGGVSRAELSALLRSLYGEEASPSEARKVVRKFDKDRDRAISATEWSIAFRSGLEFWDKDEDGKVTRAELEGK